MTLLKCIVVSLVVYFIVVKVVLYFDLDHIATICVAWIGGIISKSIQDEIDATSK